MNMTETLVTVRHTEDAVVEQRMCAMETCRIGLDVRAQIAYEPSQTREALDAVERLAESLRKQIADAAERVNLDD